MVGALHSGGVAAGRPNALVSQKNGVCWVPENTGPVIGWSITVRRARPPCPTMRARMSLRPSTRPVTSPRSVPSGSAAKAEVTSAPLRVTRTWSGAVPSGTETASRTSSPLTNDGRGLDSEVIVNEPPVVVGAAVAPGATARPAASAAVVARVRIARFRTQRSSVPHVPDW